MQICIIYDDCREHVNRKEKRKKGKRGHMVILLSFPHTSMQIKPKSTIILDSLEQICIHCHNNDKPCVTYLEGRLKENKDWCPYQCWNYYCDWQLSNYHSYIQTLICWWWRWSVDCSMNRGIKQPAKSLKDLNEKNIKLILIIAALNKCTFRFIPSCTTISHCHFPE